MFCLFVFVEKMQCCFALIVFLLLCGCWCSMSLPRSGMGWSLCAFVFNILPTAEVEWRRGPWRPIVSSDRLEEPGIKLGDPWVQGEWFIHSTTPDPHGLVYGL